MLYNKKLNFSRQSILAYGVFEFALLFAIMTTLIFGSWGLTAMFQAKNSIESELESVLAENSIAAWELDEGTNLKLNKSKLEFFLNGKVDNLYSSINNLHFLTPGKSVFVEVALGVLDIDSVSGKPLGEVLVERTRAKGSSEIARRIINSDFEHLFSSLNKLDENNLSLWAMPFYDNENGESMFFPKTFFIGVRAYVEAEGFAAFFNKFLMQEPVFFAIQVSALRGDVSL